MIASPPLPSPAAPGRCSTHSSASRSPPRSSPVGVAVAIAAAVYAKATLMMRVLQARDIEALIRGRLPGRQLAPS